MSDSGSRALRRVTEIAARGMDLVSFWSECSEALATALPHHDSPCWFTLDPESLLATSHFQMGVIEIPPEWLAAEYREDDVNKMADVARSRSGASTLHDATGGDPARSPRYAREMLPHGVDQELLVALRTRSGAVWGCMGLYRRIGDPMFSADDITLARSLSPLLADGARRALLAAERLDRPSDPPAVLVVDERLRVVSMSPGADAWLRRLPGAGLDRLPTAVLAVVGSALAGVPDVSPSAVVRAATGEWVHLRANPLTPTDQVGDVVVVVEPAGPERLAPVLMAAYQLTRREQDVTRRVLMGESTTELATNLFISVHTVQQHLKSIFDKTGVRSRRDLVAKIFFDHYEPRVRDNEQRIRRQLPVRGGPCPPPDGRDLRPEVGHLSAGGGADR